MLIGVLSLTSALRVYKLLGSDVRAVKFMQPSSTPLLDTPSCLSDPELSPTFAVLAMWIIT